MEPVVRIGGGGGAEDVEMDGDNNEVDEALEALEAGENEGTGFVEPEIANTDVTPKVTYLEYVSLF